MPAPAMSWMAPSTLSALKSVDGGTESGERKTQRKILLQVLLPERPDKLAISCSRLS
jgi:hypothetical protein